MIQSFLASPTKIVLVISTPPPSAEHYLNCIALQAWEDCNHAVMPIFINLAQIDSPEEGCIEKSLMKQGLDQLSISQAHTERASFILLVSGFEACGAPTNMFMRNKMHEWPGKVVFTVSPSLKQRAPCMEYYFMPCSERSLQMPAPERLECVDTQSLPATSNLFTSILLVNHY